MFRDFNVIMGPHEKMIKPSHHLSYDEYWNAIDSSNLLFVKGLLFYVERKLDRVFHSNRCLEGCTAISCSVLPKHNSNHHPLLISLETN